jgi:hypothetical protein
MITTTRRWALLFAAVLLLVPSAVQAGLLKQSTARNYTVLMVDSTDHVTGKTGATLTITASKDASAFSSITPTVTELSSGWYELALTTAHTDTLGDFAMHLTATGADPTDTRDQVVLSLPGEQDANLAAIKAKTDNLPSAIVQNQALNNLHFRMYSTTGNPKTGLVDSNFTAKQVVLDGGSFATLSGTIAEVGHGFYRLNLTADELNGVVVSIRFSATGCLETAWTFTTRQN